MPRSFFGTKKVHRPPNYCGCSTPKNARKLVGTGAALSVAPVLRTQNAPAGSVCGRIRDIGTAASGTVSLLSACRRPTAVSALIRRLLLRSLSSQTRAMTIPIKLRATCGTRRSKSSFREAFLPITAAACTSQDFSVTNARLGILRRREGGSAQSAILS
jgi:hypothetical protein